MQIFESENFVYWKYTLIQRVDDYRLLTAEGWLNLKEENYKRKFFELSKFLHSLIFFCSWSSLELFSNSLTLAQLCLKKNYEALFIGEALGFKKTLSLSFFSTCMKHEVCAEGKFFLSPFFHFFFITLHLSHYFAFES